MILPWFSLKNVRQLTVSRHALLLQRTDAIVRSACKSLRGTDRRGNPTRPCKLQDALNLRLLDTVRCVAPIRDPRGGGSCLPDLGRTPNLFMVGAAKAGTRLARGTRFGA
jgi:hypothetical protein